MEKTTKREATNYCHIATTSTDLAIKAEQYTQEVKVPEEYQKHHKVFSEEEAQRFPPTRPWDHTIEFHKDVPKTIDCKIYPLTQMEDKALIEFLNEEFVAE